MNSITSDHGGRGDRTYLGFPFWQPHNPAFWVYAVLLAVGLVHAGQVMSVQAGQHPQAAVLATVLWIAYTLPWVALISHRQLYARLSARAAWLGFAFGAFVSTFAIALNANAAWFGILAKTTGDTDLVAEWGASLTAPWVEELAKALGIVLVLLLASERLRSPFEAAVLGAMVGLGFQVLEDWIYSLNATDTNFGQNDVGAVLSLFWMRGIVGLWSHAMYSALVGAGVGFLVSRGSRNVLAAIGCIAAGVALHAFWDSPLLASPVLIPVKVLPAVFVYGFVYRRLVGRERSWFAATLAPEVAQGVVSAEETEQLATTYRARKKHWKEAANAHGKEAGEAIRAFEAALVQLADAVDDGDGAGIDLARAEVARTREKVTP